MGGGRRTDAGPYSFTDRGRQAPLVFLHTHDVQRIDSDL